ncbi:MAG: HD domain-containing protein [Rhodobacteraceae bacterium]|uniref:HD domain-containing phosphohydrolase n=1 Tax=Amaricoccus sp. TaxID=1872485 RepID=UPI001DF31620|nr:HD domain-containing phosphohydrolase [Amaricoccus sp.]MCB1374313.1 HD domain-containing protein [Paracoccaceae bacterium]MCB1401693.1 HD domain-containing protein [Paracoccaceae bacterium]HRW15102.1 HD domain-containing phosphohydrolase [Amaricoccus sp.]
MMLLAYATDLATGQSRDFALRSCVLAMRLADEMGLGVEERREVFHQAILRYIGCNADTHLLASAFGDEIAMRQDMALADLGSQSEIGNIFVRAFTRVFADMPPEELNRAIQEGLAGALEIGVPILAGHCEVAQRIGQRIGLEEGMLENLAQLYERWDGHGMPRGLKGSEVRLPVRMVTLAQEVIALAEAYGFDAMIEAIGKRRGGAYEAELADLFLGDAERLLDGIDGAVDRETILALEPEPYGLLDEAACEEAYVAIADMIDMRMPFTFGHSRAVAALGEAAGRCMGLPEADIRAIRWAAYTHDIGELSVPVSTWMKATPFSVRETDTAHLHPYHGERALAALGAGGEPVAALVLRHHERLDGSGYHRYAKAADLSPAARILAAAEAYQTAREDRPHRPAMTDQAAAAKLRGLVREGKLCPDGVEAVLTAAGQASRRASVASPGGLTPRELEVLRLIAAGHTAKETAQMLEIAPKTADNHIQNLYSKIGVSTRAGAALYALERGLVRQEIAA